MRLQLNTLKFLESVKQKYVQDYLAFYDSLTGYYISSKGLSISHTFTADKQEVKRVISNIDQIMNSFGEVSKSDVDSLFASMDVVEKKLKYYVELSQSDIELNDRLQMLYNKRGISLAQLLSTQKVIKSRTQELIKPALTSKVAKGWETVSKVAPEFTGLFPRTIEGLVGAALGPFAGIGTFVTRTIGSLLSGYRRYRKVSQEQAIAKSLLPTEEQTPRAFARLYGYLHGGGIGGEEYQSPYFGESYGARRGRPAKESSGLLSSFFGGSLSKDISSRQETAVATGLFTFFNTSLASRAKWTREIYEALTGRGKIGETAGVAGKAQGWWDKLKGIVIGIPQAVTKALKGIGTIVKPLIKYLPTVAGAAMGVASALHARAKSTQEGWLTGVPGKPQAFGQNVASIVGGFLGGSGKGLGEKGSTWGGVLSNTAWTTLQGILLGSRFGLPGMIIGGLTGLSGGLVGGRRISQGLQAVTRFVSGQDVKTGEKLSPISNKLSDALITSSPIVSEELKILTGQVKQALDQMNGYFKKLSEREVGMSSGTDTHSARDPFQSYLNTGNVDLSS